MLPATIRIGIATNSLNAVVRRLMSRSGYSTENRTGYSGSLERSLGSIATPPPVARCSRPRGRVSGVNVNDQGVAVLVSSARESGPPSRVARSRDRCARRRRARGCGPGGCGCRPARAAYLLDRVERARLRARGRLARARLLGDRAGDALSRDRLARQGRDHRDRLPRQPGLVRERPRPGALARADVPQLRGRRVARPARRPTPRTRSARQTPRSALRGHAALRWRSPFRRLPSHKRGAPQGFSWQSGLLGGLDGQSPDESLEGHAHARSFENLVTSEEHRHTAGRGSWKPTDRCPHRYWTR